MSENEWIYDKTNGDDDFDDNSANDHILFSIMFHHKL